jgi:5'-3' exonuclease
MGVPGLFINIFKNRSYKNIHHGINKSSNTKCDYFFMDYNGIVYSAYERIKKNFEGKNLKKDNIEELIIDEVIRYTKYLITEVLKPQVMTYISFDGPAPRAKMVQQRSRRFKAAKDKVYYQELKQKYGIDSDKNEWDRSANISPGTEFMEKLSEKILDGMKKKIFSVHNNNMQIVLSTSNVPGEGEHKFMGFIRDMRKVKSKENDSVYIYGKDADLIVLATSTHKNNSYVVREVSAETDYDLKKQYESFEFLVINIDNLRKGFFNDLTKTMPQGTVFDAEKVLNDYIFLTFLVGNDFVLSMHFLKIRKGGLKTIIAIYNEVKKVRNDYLVIYDYNSNEEPKINNDFFKELMGKIASQEDTFMKEHKREITKYFDGYREQRSIESEATKSPYEIQVSRYVHEPVCSTAHPFKELYFNDFTRVDYNNDHEVWKREYYDFYLYSNNEKIIIDVCNNYLESLLFTLKYYYTGCPSWTWHYKHRIAPLPSDVYNFLSSGKVNIENIKFELGNPYTPFQQLMMILPPQMNELIPKSLRPIMLDEKNLCIQFYPTDFRLDASVGIKFEYCEAILPEINEELLLEKVRAGEEKLTENEKKRNKLEKAKIVK